MILCHQADYGDLPEVAVERFSDSQTLWSCSSLSCVFAAYAADKDPEEEERKERLNFHFVRHVQGLQDASMRDYLTVLAFALDV